MPTREANGPQRRSVGSEFVRNDYGRGESMLLKQFPHEFQRGSLVAPSLDQHIENFAFAVDGPPHIRSPAAQRDQHLVQMPPIVGPCSNDAEIPGDRWPEF